MENTMKRQRTQKQITAKMIYDYLIARKEVGKYATASIHEELGIERSRYYSAMQYLTEKGYIKHLGRIKEGDEFFQKFSVDKEFIPNIPRIDISELRGPKANAAAAERFRQSSSITIEEIKKEELEDKEQMQLPKMDIAEENPAEIDTSDSLIDAFDILEKALDGALTRAEKLKDELFIAQQALRAEKGNREVLKRRINNLTDRINKLR
ncbi:MAG TPA: hypothetical protein VK190_02540 [Pseudoneobacillus sp.]|nr:hypothetical protein [Pseudoneobacillus sp.]